MRWKFMIIMRNENILLQLLELNYIFNCKSNMILFLFTKDYVEFLKDHV